MNLAGQAASGTVYRLRDATVTVTGPDSTQVFHTEDDPNRTSLSANVVVGDYSALLSPGFRIERIHGMTATTIDAELISPNPSAFTVLPQQRTTVPLRFRVDAEEVDLTQGYDVVLEIDEVANHGLVVANFLRNDVEVFETTANGDAVPLREFGSSTLLNPRGVAVVGSEIVVVEQGGAAVDVFPLDASGAVSPTRRISGSATGLSTASGVLVQNGEIYVIQQSDAILVFPLGASGDVAPTRTISGIGQGQYAVINNGEMYVTDFGGGVVRVFAAGTSGPAMPTRIISGVGAPSGVLIQNDELFVADGGSGVIRVFARTANGAATPLRTITPDTALGFIDQLSISRGELYVASFSTDRVAVFPVNANGTITPTRLIAGPSTGLSGPVGTFVF
jgi:6-phosphogluconolactonase (cycloisomerase 2 family)